MAAVRESEYDLIISFNVHGDIDGESLVYDPDGTIKITETEIVDVPTDCNITFLIGAQCGVSNFIDDNATWTDLLRTSIQRELQKPSSKDLAQRIKPVLVQENKRYEKQEKDRNIHIRKWSASMDTAWQIVKPRRYYNKMYGVDPLHKIPEPFVVYYCSPDSRVTKETVQTALLEWVEPFEFDQKDVSRKDLIDILTSFGFKNILIIDASCSDFVNGTERTGRYVNKLMKRIGGRKRTRNKRSKKYSKKNHKPYKFSVL